MGVFKSDNLKNYRVDLKQYYNVWRDIDVYIMLCIQLNNWNYLTQLLITSTVNKLCRP